MAETTSHKGRTAFLILLVVLFGVGAKFWFLPSETPPQLITAKAVKMDMQETVLASGTLKAYKIVSVGAQASGQIKSLKVSLGDHIEKGQLVAEIDSLNQQNTLKNNQAALDNVRAQLSAKEATLRQTEAAFRRQENLRTKDAVSLESFQSAEATYKTAMAEVEALKAQVTQAEIDVDTAKVNLGYTQITAPIDGTVVAVIVEEGQTVNASQETPTIIKVAQLDKMTIKAEISEADVTRVKEGQKVFFTIMGEPDHPYYATLRAIEPAPDSISSTTSSSTSSTSSSTSSSSSSSAIYYNGLFEAPNDDGKLRISMTAQISIVLDEAKNAIAIPRTALGKQDKDGTYSVQVMNLVDHRVNPRKVRIGLNDNVNVQITDGLSEGEEVVVGQASATAIAASQSNNRPPPMGF